MRKYGVIGDPINHSLSPLLHGEIYSQIGMPISYNKQLIKNSELSSFVIDNKLQSYNVTIPHKESILHFLDSLDSVAVEIGAVNCVMNKKGFNTDWLGFIKAMAFNKVEIKDKNCLIIGAGGVAKAICYALIKSKSKSIDVINRSRRRKKELVRWISSYGIKNNKKEMPDIIINCTPIGMWPNAEILPININKIHTNQIIVDTIYNPIETEWIKLSRKKGAFTIGGLDMFIFQGIASAEIWENKNITNSLKLNQIKKVLKLELC